MNETHTVLLALVTHTLITHTLVTHTHTLTQRLGIAALSHVWGYSIAGSSCIFSRTFLICLSLMEGKCERGGQRRGKIRNKKVEKRKRLFRKTVFVCFYFVT